MLLFTPSRHQFRRKLPWLCQLYRDTYAALPQYSYREAAEVESYLRWLYDGDPAGFFVACLDGNRDQPLAFAAMHGDWQRQDGQVVAELHEVVVAPQWQGKGIGTTLIRRAITRARRLGREVVELWVGEQNHRAAALYERLGFQRTGQWRHWVRMELRPPAGARRPPSAPP